MLLKMTRICEREEAVSTQEDKANEMMNMLRRHREELEDMVRRHSEEYWE